MCEIDWKLDEINQFFEENLMNFIFRVKNGKEETYIIEATDKITGNKRNYMLVDLEEQMFTQLTELNHKTWTVEERKLQKRFNKMLMKLLIRYQRRKSSQNFNEMSNMICQADISHYTNISMIYEYTYHGATDKSYYDIGWTIDNQDMYNNFENDLKEKQLMMSAHTIICHRWGSKPMGNDTRYYILWEKMNERSNSNSMKVYKTSKNQE
jgi:hypothetical protein